MENREPHGRHLAAHRFGATPVPRSTMRRVLTCGGFAVAALLPSAHGLAQSLPQGIRWPTIEGGQPVTRIVLLGKPHLEIGTADGPDPTLLSGVIGAVRMEDGRIAIGDAATNRVLVFDSAGSFVTALGRTGDGPGEFRLPRWLGRCANDQLAVYDAAHNSVSLFSATGTLTGSLPLPPIVSFDRMVWCADQRSAFMLFNQPRDQVYPGEHLAIPVSLVRISTGARVDTLFAGGIQDYYSAKRIGAVADVPLGRAILVAAGTHGVYTCRNADGEVSVFDTAGSPVRHFRLQIRPVAFSAGYWPKAKQSRIDAEPLARSRKVLEAVLDEIAPPSAFPVVDQLQADVNDNLWVRTFDNYQSAVATWLVLDPSGRPLATVAIPRELQALQIGDGYLLGLARDAEGVERVSLRFFPPLRRQ